MSIWNAAAVVAVAAACTFVTRAAPFVAFGGKREVPQLVRYLGQVLPPAVMAVLIVYCLKGVRPGVYPHGLPELLSITVVAGLHLWKRNNLLSIGLGTVCYMLLVQFVFV